MNNAVVLDRVMDGVLSWLRLSCPELTIVRNDSTDERVIPMICVSPEACDRDGCEDVWNVRVQVESVQYIDVANGLALGALARVSDAFMGVKFEGFGLSRVVDTECGVVISDGAITYSSVFEFIVSL